MNNIIPFPKRSDVQRTAAKRSADESRIDSPIRIDTRLSEDAETDDKWFAGVVAEVDPTS